MLNLNFVQSSLYKVFDFRALLIGALVFPCSATAQREPRSPIPYANGAHLRATYTVYDSSIVNVMKASASTDRTLVEAATAAAQRQLPAGFHATLTNTTHVDSNVGTPRALSPKTLLLYRVSYHGIALTKGSDVLVILSSKGRLLVTRRRQIPTIVDSVVPRLRASDGIARAVADARRTFPNIDLRAAPNPVLEIHTDERQLGTLTWSVSVRSNSPSNAIAVQYWVSASTGAIIARENAIYHAAGVAEGPVWDTPFAQPVLGSMSNLTIAVQGSSNIQSDDTGKFSTPTPPAFPGTLLLNAWLAGRFAIINDITGHPLEATTGVSSAPTVTLSFVPRTIPELAQTSAYHWVTFANHFTSMLHQPDEQLLGAMLVNVNVDAACNSAWNSIDHSMDLFSAGTADGQTCVNAAYSDVVLHEYGHAIDQVNGGILDGPYSEGFGDSDTILATQQSLVGRDFFGQGTRLRDAATLLTWPAAGPDPFADPHAIGNIYSGFVWDLVQQLKAKYADNDAFGIAKELVFAAAAANPQDIPDAVMLSFYADYDADNLSSCSPHFAELAAAADRHMIPRPGNCTDAALFQTVYAVPDNGPDAPNGLAGFDFLDPADRAVAFDYDADRRQDLLLYRPGTGIAWVVHSNANDSFTATYKAGDNGNLPAQGIAGYDLSSLRDRVLALPDHRIVISSDGFPVHFSDELFLYRPGTGAAWVARSAGPGNFVPTYAQGDPGAGIGGYDLRSDHDAVLPLDFDGDGRQDFFLYRHPDGRASVIHSSSDGTVFTAAFTVPDNGPGIAGFALTGQNDRVLSLDYDGDKKDDLLLYRPGTGEITIAHSNGDGTFAPVYSQTGSGAAGIAGFDLKSVDDRIVVFDFDQDGKDDLFLYRPGGRLAVVARSNGDGSFSAIPQGHTPVTGFAGYDFASKNDQVIALNHNGHRTDLLFYRPGQGAVWIVRADASGKFHDLYSIPDNGPDAPNGIGGYDFLSSADRALAFDFNGDGNDDLLLYRPGHGAAYVLKSLGK